MIVSNYGSNPSKVALNLAFGKFLQRRLTSKIVVELNQETLNKLENNEIKPRKHPGIYKTSTISIPQNLVEGIIKSCGDFPVKSILNDSIKLCNYLHSRHPPPDEENIKTKLERIQSEIDTQFPLVNTNGMSEEEFEHYKRKKEMKMKYLLKQRTFAWKPMSYGKYESLIYAVGRSAQEYASIYKIFKEISLRDPQFKPRSYFDFGSGLGSGMWAVSAFWKDTIFEYFNVDTSRDMNDLSDLILREGNDNQQSILRNVFYRQFLPASEVKYDIVLSAFSLFELENKRSRRDILKNLWKKCDHYMIIIEEGTRNGFELVEEARKFILNQNEEELIGHTFSPCSHDFQCPRLADLNDHTPCNYEVGYTPFPIGQQSRSQKRSWRYSYVVLKKGKAKRENTELWPRIVRPTLVRKKHAICRMCTSEGKLQEVIFTASKHGKFAYHCARSSRWGDRLPIILGERRLETEEE